MLLEHERKYGLGMDAAGPRMLLEHECSYYGLVMDALKWQDRKRDMARDYIEQRAGCRCGARSRVSRSPRQVCTWRTLGVESLKIVRNFCTSIVAISESQSWKTQVIKSNGVGQRSDTHISEASPRFLHAKQPRQSRLEGCGGALLRCFAVACEWVVLLDVKAQERVIKDIAPAFDQCYLLASGSHELSFKLSCSGHRKQAA